jgi:hypothetical protein
MAYRVRLLVEGTELEARGGFFVVLGNCMLFDPQLGDPFSSHFRVCSASDECESGTDKVSVNFLLRRLRSGVSWVRSRQHFAAFGRSY